MTLDELDDGLAAADFVVGALGSLFGALAAFIFVGSAIAGFPIWSPPSFTANWNAFQAARRGHVNWDTVAAS